LFIARRKYMSQQVLNEFLTALCKIPDQVRKVLEQSELIKTVTEMYTSRENWLFLGRGYNYPVALEGALKLKEISYIHAEGLPAAEMKHGPIALINAGMPVVFITPRGSQYEKILGNIQEVKARGGKIIAVASEGDEHIHTVADHVFTVPETSGPALTVGGWFAAWTGIVIIVVVGMLQLTVEWMLPFRTTDGEAQIVAVRQGLGIAALNCFVGDADPLLARVPGAELHMHGTLWLLTQGEARKTKRVRLFTDFVARRLAAYAPLLAGLSISRD